MPKLTRQNGRAPAVRLKIVPEPGSALRAHCQGYSSRCTNCSKPYSWDRHPHLVPGAQCPRCGSVLEARFHLVDLGANDGVGQCGCEHWEIEVGPAVAGMTRAERLLAVQNPECKLWCSHLRAVRNWRLNSSIFHHVASQGGGREDGL